MDGVVDYQYVQVDDIINNQQDGKFTFSADSISNKNVRATNVDFDNSDKYSWHGSTYDRLFSMIINKSSNGFSGAIIDDENDKLYRLFAIDSTKSIMLEFGETSNELSCPHETTPTSGPSPTGLENCDDICPGNIDILFLLPQETQDWLVSEENYLSYIQLMISDLEMAWTNSQIVHTVDYTWVNYDWVDPNLMFCQPIAIALANDLQAQTLKANNNADIVILLAPPLTTWNDATACVAEIGPINNDAYGIVPIDVAFQEFTFTHEIGHILVLSISLLPVQATALLGILCYSILGLLMSLLKIP